MDEVELSSFETTYISFEGFCIGLEAFAPVSVSAVARFDQVTRDGRTSIVQGRFPRDADTAVRYVSHSQVERGRRRFCSGLLNVFVVWFVCKA